MLSAQKEAAVIRKILIADDSNTERLNLLHILEAAGFQVITAQSGNEAKALAEAELPDLIMLDIIMDDGDGYQACRGNGRRLYGIVRLCKHTGIWMGTRLSGYQLRMEPGYKRADRDRYYRYTCVYACMECESRWIWN